MVEKDKMEEIIATASAIRPKAQRVSNGAFTIAVGIVALLIGLILGGNIKSIYNKIAPAFNAPVADSLDLSSVQDLYNAIKDNYVGDIDETALVDGAKRGLASALDDPYTTFMTENEETTLTNDINGNFSGIGAELSVRNNFVTVVRLIQGSPAQKSGLQIGDIIYTVDGEDMSKSTPSSAADHIRGESGTKVELVIARGNELKTFSITRTKITNPNVYNEIRTVNGKRIMILHITSFSQDAGDLAYTQVRQALSNGKLDGVVLDMRGNGGGYVSSAQSVAALWLDGESIMTERHIGGETIIKSLSGRDILADIPTVVLVNGSSASASEIVAGALHDHDKAILIGEKTYGKGSMQELVGLSDGNYLKVTIANWYTPNGFSMNKQGLEPDETVGLTIDDLNAGRDPQLDAGLNKLTK